MWCGICDKELKDCTCSDLEQRLDAIAKFSYRRCVACKKHYGRCRCTRTGESGPAWEFVIGGKVIDKPENWIA